MLHAKDQKVQRPSTEANLVVTEMNKRCKGTHTGFTNLTFTYNGELFDRCIIVYSIEIFLIEVKFTQYLVTVK